MFGTRPMIDSLSWYLSSWVTYKGLGWKRHYLRDEDHTVCHQEINGNWVVGDDNPPTSNARTFWCKICFPAEKFTIVQAQLIQLKEKP